MGTTLGVAWATVDPRVDGLLFSGAGGILVEIAVTAVEEAGATLTALAKDYVTSAGPKSGTRANKLIVDAVVGCEQTVKRIKLFRRAFRCRFTCSLKMTSSSRPLTFANAIWKQRSS